MSRPTWKNRREFTRRIRYASVREAWKIYDEANKIRARRRVRRKRAVAKLRAKRQNKKAQKLESFRCQIERELIATLATQMAATLSGFMSKEE